MADMHRSYGASRANEFMGLCRRLAQLNFFEDARPAFAIVGSSLRADDPPRGRLRALVREAAREIYRAARASALPAREFARAWWIAPSDSRDRPSRT